MVLSLLRDEVAKTTAGEQVRDYLHVEDIASALWAVAQSGVTGPVNIASGTTTTVREVVREIAELVGKPDLLQLGVLPYRAGEPMVIRAKTACLRERVGWSPRYDLRRGLDQTIAWWKDRLHSGVWL